MKYCPEENFDQLAEAIERIERHIGLKNDGAISTINGRLNNIYDALQRTHVEYTSQKYIAGENLLRGKIVFLEVKSKNCILQIKQI